MPLYTFFCRGVGCTEQFSDDPAMLVVNDSKNVVKFSKGHPDKKSILWRVQEDGDVDLDDTCTQYEDSATGASDDSDRKWYNCDDRNPCSNKNFEAGKTYFPAKDNEYFIQCGSGPPEPKCHVQACEPGSVWKQKLLTCIGKGQNYWK